jgi:two-component system NtrC family sensor kinase
MNTKKKQKNPTSASSWQTLSNQIVDYSNMDLPRVDFLKEVSKTLLDFSGSDAIELWLKKDEQENFYKLIRSTKRAFYFKVLHSISERNEENTRDKQINSDLERFLGHLINGDIDSSFPFYSPKGSFWTGDIDKTSREYSKIKTEKHFDIFFTLNRDYKSIVLIPLKVGKRRVGIFQLMSQKKNFFTESEIDLYENFAPTLGLSLLNQGAQAALRERVKELTCLYGIAQTVERYGASIDEILNRTVNLLPPAWQYPQITQARILLNEKQYLTPGFKSGLQKQTADIVVKGIKQGYVEVVYTEKRPIIGEGPFLREERHLVDTVAKELSLIIGRKHSELDKMKLQEQLLHADRLATIGQLASGVAHELNEPLGNILGFVQLVQKDPELSDQAKKDTEKILNASLHAREIVRKLLIFARQMPTRKTRINLNHVVEDGLFFLESRCQKEGIEIVRLLARDMPEVIVDPSQFTQVLVNLVVNALQAMPAGGKLTIQTLVGNDCASLIVEDTGVGMSKKILKKIFLPFFTTKDVGQGTGLGLSVTHGIVTSHGGSIKVDSQVGRGSRFEINIPLTDLSVQENK